MKLFKFILSLSITIAICYSLSTKIGPAPPLGKFLDPSKGFWANAENRNNLPPETINLPGLNQPVTVKYDSLLIPHIFAANDEDLYMTQGFIHAYFRLWQMEFQTHAAGGRISEIVGDIALDLDRSMRRRGMVYGAKRTIESLPPDMANLLQKYTEGINTHIASLSYKDYPFEYKLLDYAPEDWTPLKTGLLYKYMSDMLNRSEKDIQNTNFVNIYGRELFDLVYPDVDNYQDPVVDRTNDWDFNPIQRVKGTDTIIVRNDVPKNIAKLDLIPQAHPNNGSNNWAVSAKRSETGNAILCNDMHLNLYLPSLWFYTQQNSDDINVLGHTLPGIPFIITGFTDSIAWGFTNAQRDLVDWFLIEFEDGNKDRYYLDGGYVNTEMVIEEIKLRGKEPFMDTVYYTEFGPVVYDDNFRPESGKKGYAMRWIDHDPSAAFNMFYLINRAKNYADFNEAADNFPSPAQNVVFASVKGDVAHRVQGKYPLKGYEEGKFLLDGTYSGNNWTQFIPNEHNAQWYNPDRGFVSSANQHPADSTYPYYITARSYESYRNRRINDVLRQDSSISIEDMKRLHYDNFSMKASESLPLMLSYLDSAAGSLTGEQMEVVSRLKEWDYYFTRDSESATYYDTWYYNLFGMIWDEIRDSDADLQYPTSNTTIRLMHEYPSFKFYDNRVTPETEGLKDLVLESFIETYKELTEWEANNGSLEWGNYNSTTVQHLSRQGALSVSGVITDGNGGDVVNATNSYNGPSQRIIVELDPAGVKAIGHYPGGQSGNPGSKYYDTMIDGWANGIYFDLHLWNGNSEDGNVVFTQTIESEEE